MIAARFDVELPADTMICDVSTAFPEATYRLLSGVNAGETAVQLGEVVAGDPRAAGGAIADHELVTSYEWLEVDEERGLAKYETRDTALYEFMARSDVPVQFPVVVRDGWYRVDFVGTRAEFEGFRDTLSAHDRPYELLSLVHETDSEALLSERQRTVLATALRLGYLEVPRECTLSELAAALDVTESTASRTLRRALQRVTAQFLTTPDE
ncbi:helix-turn-helix domain-containing protein [Halobaculum sp. MBLA0147]|uniref:helix-turn-helix domain-containing protein n=1 Tax=Halobaculum sp. MBLA0147 TaxID=3079934 RepID=UPI00352520EF